MIFLFLFFIHSPMHSISGSRAVHTICRTLRPTCICRVGGVVPNTFKIYAADAHVYVHPHYKHDMTCNRSASILYICTYVGNI